MNIKHKNILIIIIIIQNKKLYVKFITKEKKKTKKEKETINENNEEEKKKKKNNMNILYVNYHYKITWIDKENKKISIIDPYDEEAQQMTFDFSILIHFQPPYCNTCHSVQGLTINGEYTIFDANTPYVDRNFLWTALARATDLKKYYHF